MSGYQLARRARADLDGIWDYTHEHWGTEQARVYLQLLRDAASKVAERPGLGKPCDELRAGYLRYNAGSHVLFYRRRKDDVLIVRILHGQMDHIRYL